MIRAGSPTYTSYRRYNNAEFKARAFKLKAEFTTGAIDEQIAVDQLRVVANMPIRTITGSVTTNAAAVSDTDVSVDLWSGQQVCGDSICRHRFYHQRKR